VSLHLEARLEARELDVTLEVPAGQTLALIGPNGSGKSSVLDILAGLIRPDSGRADLDGRTLFSLGVQGEPATWVPAHRRNVALLAQEPLLFPHLSVVDNVGFGPRSLGESRADSRASAGRWLAEVESGDLGQRRPAHLSGGQAQRVALARALAAQPDLLLLDEPLAALDVDVAAAVRQTLRRVLADRTAILVTHEVLDAVLLADRIAVLESGRVVESGTTAQVMRQPRSAFAASICGLNMLTGTATGPRTLSTDSGTTVHGLPDAPLDEGEHAIAVFRPSALSVHRTPPTGSPRNVFTGTVTALEPQAHLVRVRCDHLSADITPASVAELDLALGAVVHLAVKAAEVSIYHA
jgi:molybdate transport system ATP-binding protein